MITVHSCAAEPYSGQFFDLIHVDPHRVVDHKRRLDVAKSWSRMGGLAGLDEPRFGSAVVRIKEGQPGGNSIIS